MAQLQITGNNLEITPTLRDFIEGKFKRLERHADTITNIHLVLTVNNRGRQKAETRLHIPGNEIYAHTESNDMYKTIDALIDKLVRQLQKHIGKINGRR